MNFGVCIAAGIGWMIAGFTGWSILTAFAVAIEQLIGIRAALQTREEAQADAWR